MEHINDDSIKILSVSNNSLKDSPRSYKLLYKIGSGRFSNVFKAQEMLTDKVDFYDTNSPYFRGEQERYFALKISSSDDLDKDFEHEKKALNILHEQNYIAKVDYWGHDVEGRYCLVMEYIDGQKITDYCAGKLLGFRIALMEEVIHSVHKLHFSSQYQIIHRDLKPDNIIVSNNNGRPYIIDFNIAKIRPKGETAKVTTIKAQKEGTLKYMSPEQHKGKLVDFRCDIWALGLILYELIEGYIPFDNVEEERMGLKFSSALWDRELKAICKKALEPKPENRYQSAEIFANLLQQWRIKKAQKHFKSAKKLLNKRILFSRKNNNLSECEEKIKEGFSFLRNPLDIIEIQELILTFWQKKLNKDRLILYFISERERPLGLENCQKFSKPIVKIEKIWELESAITDKIFYLIYSRPEGKKLANFSRFKRDELVAFAEVLFYALSQCYQKMEGLSVYPRLPNEDEIWCHWTPVGLETKILAYRWPYYSVKKGNPSLLCVGDIKKDFIRKLKDTQHPVSQYIMSLFTPELQQQMKIFNEDEILERLQQNLVNELNCWLGDFFYREDIFKRIRLSEQTKELINQNPQGDDLVRLNRLLLEETFPKGIMEEQSIKGEDIFNFLKEISENSEEDFPSFWRKLPKEYLNLGAIDFLRFLLGNEYYERARILEKRGLIKKAIGAVSKSISFAPYPKIYGFRAALYFEIGALPEALEDYQLANFEDPHLNHVCFAQAYEKRGMYENALDAYARAIKLEPKIALFYKLRGAIYYKMSKMREAFNDYSKAIELDPKDSSLYKARADISAKNKNFKEALKDYKKAIELDPQDLSLCLPFHKIQANIAAKNKNFEEALENYSKAIELDQSTPELYILRAAMHNQLGNYNDSLKDCLRAMKINPNELRFKAYEQLYLAKIHTERNLERALQYCINANGLYPLNNEIKEYLEYIQTRISKEKTRANYK